MSKLFIIVMFIILAILWGIQGFFTYCQLKNVQKNYKEIYNAYTQDYFFGMGSSKGLISKGCMIFIVVDLSGNIIHSRILDGRSVFDKFKIYNDIIGENIYSFINEEENRNSQKNIFNNKNRKLTSKEKAILMASKNIGSYLKQNRKEIGLKEC